MKRFAVVVTGLLLVLGLSAYWYVTYREGWRHELSLNLAAEVFGIFFTVLFIDLLNRSHERQERERIRRLALLKLGRSVGLYFRFLMEAYKAAAPSLPGNVPRRPFDLFTDDFFEQVPRLDLSQPAPSVIAQAAWFEYAARRVEEFQRELAATLDRYFIVCHQSDLELFESLLESEFMRYVTLTRNMPSWQPNRNQTYNAWVIVQAELRRDAMQLLRLVTLYDEVAPKPLSLPDEVWRADVEPQVCSARAPENANAQTLGLVAGPPPVLPARNRAVGLDPT